MFSPILNTKLFIPPHREENIPRTRLYELLEGNLGQKVILISAPAGFGKTTLVSEWLHQQNAAVAWISLDENDSDPQRFFTYLISALQRTQIVDDEIAFKLLESLKTTPLEIILTGLINNVAEMGRDCILILDDYHLIDSPAVHEGLIFLFYNSSPRFRFLILSRNIPPLTISKLRATNQLVMLTADDLRFTRTETETFLKDAMKLNLSNLEIDKLTAHTEGWVTALQLAAFSLKSVSGVTDFLDKIAECDQYIAEYLADEVISNEPDHIKEFLIHTSLLKNMCAEICNFMLGIEDSHFIIEELHKSNLFITPLDTTSTWYRYHGLFAEFLQHNLKSKPEEEICKLHRSAAEWYLTHEMIEDGIEHLLEAGDYSRVIQHIEEMIDEILGKAKFGICLKWLDEIPDSFLSHNPMVVLHQAFFLYEMGQFEKCYQRLAFVEEIWGLESTTTRPDSDSGALLYGCLNSIRGVIHSSQGEIEKAFEHATRALALLPERSIFWRVISSITIAFCHRIMRNYGQAIEKISKALELASEAKFIFLYFMSTSFLSKLLLDRGLLFDAMDTCQKALDQDARTDYKIPFTGSTYLLMGELLFLSGDVEAAERHVHRGLEAVTKAGDIFSISRGHYLLARIYFAMGQSDSALLTMDRLDGVIEPFSPSATALRISNAYQAYIRILCNQFDLAQEWGRQPDIDKLDGKTFPDLIRLPYLGSYRVSQEPLSHLVDFIRYTQARLDMVTGNYEKALVNIDNALKSAERKGRKPHKARLLILKSLILDKKDQSKKAIDTFISVVKLISPREFSQIFIEEGPPLLSLVRKVHNLLASQNGGSTKGIDEETLSSIKYILDRMLSEREKTCKRIDQKKPPNVYFELTPRELEVLAWLSRGFSYDETASHLHISKNTIKTHLKRIYSKLEVGNRLQAVNKAKEMGLIV